ncbi:uncharacterized protein LOC131949800 [Physella acuta]|uniref:uncharacterized protein LOC131949800 n=1 Tax=Physella acuta TaxID=109671 RepID=UPI0027DC69B7|nr:uncharacterized protein LOC131949800 [Physella acuta]
MNPREVALVAKSYNGLQFDPREFKANRQMRTIEEVKRILRLPPEERTDDEIHCAMIGLRGINSIAEYPVRMQRYLAQYGAIECYDARRVIIKQGRVPEAFYYILYGRVIVAVKDDVTGRVEMKCYLQRGHFFGEIAIIQGSCRQSSVMTASYTELLSLSKNEFEKYFMVGGVKNINDPDHNSFVKSLHFLKDWPLELILSGTTDHKHVAFGYFKRGSVLVKDSNFSDWLIVVKSGSLTVMKKLLQPAVGRTAGRVKSRINSSRDTREGQLGSSFVCSKSRASREDRRDRCSAQPIKTLVTGRWSNEKRLESLPVKSPEEIYLKAKPDRSASLDFSNNDVIQVEDKMTFLDYLDSAYNKRPHLATEADTSPQFVILQTLTKGAVFGLAQCLFPEQPSMAVVSNGADCLMISKKLFLSHASPDMMRRLRVEVSPYPSASKLQEDLVTRVQWETYKLALVGQLVDKRRSKVQAVNYL